MKGKRILGLLLGAVVMTTTVLSGAAPVYGESMGNPDGVYLKQESRGTCTLASATMMLRQKSLNEGNATWKNITQKSVRPYAWLEGTGVWNTYTYYGMTVKRSDYKESGKKEIMIGLLQEHPEGIEIYDRNVPHAVLLTRYDADEDIFYCADPALSTNEMALGDSWMNTLNGGSDQEAIIEGIDSVWMITSYTKMDIPGEDDEADADQAADDAADSASAGNDQAAGSSAAKISDRFPSVRDYDEAGFKDVKASEWYASYIESAYEEGLMSGISAGSFEPDGNVTLAQAITIAARIYSRLYDADKEFENVTGVNWLKPYSEYAVEKGIITDETADSEFLDYEISRAQFAEIISGALKDADCSQINDIDDGDFSDIADSGSAGEAVYRLCRGGIITGDSHGLFNPEDSLTRAQMAAILARITDESQRVEL